MFRHSSNRKAPWRWIIGTVLNEEEHMELLYGDARKQDTKEFIHAALLSAPSNKTFLVQFLIVETNEQSKSILKAVREELDYYLIEKQERNPWGYAQNHCTTAANWYSNVHWVYHSQGPKP